MNDSALPPTNLVQVAKKNTNKGSYHRWKDRRPREKKESATRNEAVANDEKGQNITQSANDCIDHEGKEKGPNIKNTAEPASGYIDHELKGKGPNTNVAKVVKISVSLYGKSAHSNHYNNQAVGSPTAPALAYNEKIAEPTNDNKMTEPENDCSGHEVKEKGPNTKTIVKPAKVAKEPISSSGKSVRSSHANKNQAVGSSMAPTVATNEKIAEPTNDNNKMTEPANDYIGHEAKEKGPSTKKIVKPAKVGKEPVSSFGESARPIHANKNQAVGSPTASALATNEKIAEPTNDNNKMTEPANDYIGNEVKEKGPSTKKIAEPAKVGKEPVSSFGKSARSNVTNKNQAGGSSTAPVIAPNQPQTTNDVNYGHGQRIVILHIAEKPSIAQAIAKGLSNGSEIHSMGSGLPVYEFHLPFPKAPHASSCMHKVTSVAGHVFGLDFPKNYQSWDQVDPATLFEAPVQKSPCKGSIVKHLHEVSKGVDFICLWLDCDREGENIAFEVLECTLENMQSNRRGSENAFSNYDRVYRAHFSAINPSDILKAYHSLGKPDKNQSLSVDARQELDLKVGVAFSRFQTRYFQGRYGDLDSAVLSYGPCQTPTLGFCVQRHIDIETFKPEPYWTFTLNVMKRGRTCKASWDNGRSFNRSKLEALLERCGKGEGGDSFATVTSVVTKEKKQGRPVPLNTVNLLKACSKALGIGPHAAMQTAERLYLSGFLSYPRTESTAYPNSFDFYGTLQTQANDSRWGDLVRNLLITGPTKSKGGVDMGDHPPIVPCRPASIHELSGDMARVYELVTRHFIASISPDAVWKSTKVTLAVPVLGDDGKFTIRGKELIQPGFLNALSHKGYDDPDEYGDDDDPWQDEDENEEKCLPDFEEGECFPCTQNGGPTSSKVDIVASGSRATLVIKEKMTTAPTYLTESELIGKMEKNGIGTDASISTHIENILKRNYVELISGRKMKPTKLGLVLAQGYHLIDSSLVLPKVRSDIEDQCSKIAKGLADKDSVVKKALETFAEKFLNFVKNINKMDVLFSSSFTQLQEVGKAFTRCGLTRRYLQFIPGPPPRLYNKFTETVYPLPAGGTIKEWTGRKCSARDCNFELCLYIVGEPERTFPLCPFCFNNPQPEWGFLPGEEIVSSSDPVDRQDEDKERHYRRMGGRSLLLECPHPDGHPLIKELTVSPDDESDGVLTIDAHFGPKWRLVSTRSPTIVYLPKSIDKITVLEKTYDETGSHVMRIEFKEPSPFDDKRKKYDSCYAQDEKLQSLSRIHHGHERVRQVRGNQRGGRFGPRGSGRNSSKGGRR